MSITQEMREHYYNRTRKHISLVQKYIRKIYNDNPIKYLFLRDRIETHDKSKYEEPELTPYILITWNYYCKDNNIDFKLTKEEKELTRATTYHHVKNNRHHPEFHDDNTTIDCIVKSNRDDIPKKPVDGTNMTDIDIAEMVADWLAMSEEKNSDPIKWADQTVDKRWLFTPNQYNLIYSLINKFKLDLQR